MKPKRQDDLEEQRKAVCDQLIERAAEMMVEGAGAPIEMMIDRMLTYAAAQACTLQGSPATARTFRRLADNIEAGCFHRITGEGSPHGARH